jgi:transcriptional regulator with XRE-family HTH domain
MVGLSAYTADVITRYRGEVMGERMRALRAYAGWTQRKVSEMAHVTVTQVARYEAGKSAVPGAVWDLLCIKAGVDPDWQPDEKESTEKK